MASRPRVWPLGLWALVASGSTVAAFWVATRAVDVPFSYVSREPQTAEPDAVEWYAGSLSNLSVLVSTVAAVAALIAGTARRRAGLADDLTGFLLWGGLLIAAFTLDDLFLLHEHVYSNVLPEPIISPAYGIPSLVLVWRYRQTLRAEGGELFVAGGAALLASVAVSELWDGHHLVEDGFKLVGYAIWATYFVVLALRRVTAGDGRTDP